MFTRFSGRTVDSRSHSLTDGQIRLQNAFGAVSNGRKDIKTLKRLCIKIYKENVACDIIGPVKNINKTISYVADW